MPAARSPVPVSFSVLAVLAIGLAVVVSVANPPDPESRDRTMPETPRPPAMHAVASLPPLAPPRSPAPVARPASLRVPDGPEAASRFGLPCGAEFSAEATDGARVRLVFSDPCRPNARVEITHGALRIAERTDGLGRLEATLPALATPATYSLRLPGGETLSARAAVSDFDAFHRVVVAWRGPAELALEALEMGAAPGSRGHVRPEAPGSAARAVAGRGGYLAMLGAGDLSAAERALVYAFPRTPLREAGVVRFRLGADSATCGEAISATVLQPAADGTDRLSETALEWTPTGCNDGARVQTRLQNVLRDLRIAPAPS